MADAVKRDVDSMLSDYIRTGDKRIRDRILEAHLNVATMVASKFSGKGVEFDDLFQVASLALYKAIPRFDPDRGVKFISFITPTMIGEVKNYFRDKSRIIRLPRNSTELMRAVDKATDELTRELNRAPSMDELADKMGLPIESIIEAIEIRGAARTTSLDASPETDESDTPISNYIGFDEKGYTDFETNDQLKRAMANLTDRQRSIIEMRFFEGLSQSVVAEKLNISQMSISREERKALTVLREHIKNPED